MSRAPLTGVTALEAGGGLAGRVAGALLADLGADVTTTAPAADAHERRAYDRLKRVGRAERHYDVVLTDGDDPDDATGTVTCRIIGFGAVDTPVATERTVDALSGCMDLTGHAGRPPYAMGVPLTDLATGIHAAIGIVGALATGDARARRIEVSRYDVSVSMLSYMAVGYFANGEVPTRVGTGHSTIFPYNSFATRDGEVVVAPFTNRFWRNFCVGVGREDLLDDERLRRFAGRLQHKEWLLTELEPVMATRTVEEWVEAFRLADVPAGPVLDVGGALGLEQTAERGMIRDLPDGGRTIGSPLHFRFGDGAGYLPPTSPAPTTAAMPTEVSPVEDDDLPLAGVRVLDLTRMFAGPCATEALADLGADVIKLEKPRVGDPTRRNLPFWGEESAYFISLNRGKRSVTLDLKSPEGRDAALALAAQADIVVENYRPGVMDRLGLGADELLRRNPALVVCSLSGFGATGPLREKISFDLVNQAMAGTIDLTGDPDDRPARIGVPIGDMAGGYYTALAALAGLRAARRTGVGCHLDLALHDILVALLGSHAQAYLDTGEVPTRVGNRDRGSAPVGCYRTADAWLVLDAGDDRSWHALTELLGLPDDARSAPERKAAEDKIDRVLTERFVDRTAADWATLLTAAGVAAAPVLTLAEALDSDLARDRGLAYELPDPDVGTIRNLASPIVVDGHRLGRGATVPRLGADTEAVLNDQNQEVSAWSCASSVGR